jgi:translation initiation factor 3 subunit I
MSEYINIETKQFRGAGFMTVSKYNNSGEIVYVADKDSKSITAIETYNYNVIGSFEGHNGVIWSLDVSSDDKILISCSGDLNICFWNTNDGTMINRFAEKCIPKYICGQKKLSTNLIGVICEGLSKKYSTYISIYDLEQAFESNFAEKTKLLWNRTSKPTVLAWLNESVLIIGCDDGKIILKNINNNDDDLDIEYQIHEGPIKSIVWNKNLTQILTGSLDCTAKQIDISTWEIKAIYKSTVPINWACWNHNDRKIFVGGGIEAMNIAKTSNNDLNLKVYRTSDQKLINHMASHFGPIRYIDKSPCSKNFVTASQDGTVKIYFIKDEDSNVKQSMEQNILEDKPTIFKNFGLCSKYQLTEEINKLVNLSWKPKQKIEKKINWVPGMSLGTLKNTNIPNANANTNIPNANTNIPNKKDSGLYEIGTNDNYTNERFNQIKTLQENQNCSIRVTNLPNDIQPRDLAELFDLYGRIADRDGIKIKNYDDTTMAFIKYVYPESATKAIANLDNVAIDHYIIRVEYARQR